MQPLSFVASMLLATAGGGKISQAPDIAIVGARIEIGDGQILPSGTIVVRGNRILSVSPTSEAPSGAQIIDGKGLVVYPGFIDAYSTSGVKLPAPLPSGKTLPDTRTTAPATMWKENRKGIRSDVIVAKNLDLKGPFEDRYKQGVTTLALGGGDGMLAGTMALVDLAKEVAVVNADLAAEMVLRGGGGFRGGDAVHDMLAGGGAQRPAQAPSTEPSYPYPGTLFGYFALMRQTIADAKVYVKEDPKEKDPTYEGLRSFVTGQVPAFVTITGSKEIARAAHVAEEFGFKFIVNGVPDAYRAIPTLKKYAKGVVVSLDLPDEPNRKPGEGPDATPVEVLEDRYNTWKERQGNAKLLNEAGIPLAFRSGFGSGSYLAGVRKVIAAGLPREAALKAMTSGAASLLGVSSKLGTIAEGKLANLVIMTGDFADDKSTVKAVLVEGTRTDLAKEPAK